MAWMQLTVARRHEAAEGLTLIEMLIVVLLLGVLATIVLLGISAFQGTGEHQACTATSKTVEGAAAGYYSKNGSWPTVAQLTGASPPYLKSTPKAAWGIAVNTSTGDVTNTCP